jgi:glycosyltransferase involved in cell wall biosynthesis
MSATPSRAPLSVVICTYNNVRCLGEALHALGAQKDRARAAVLPVLVIDNNSTDGTAALIAQVIAAGSLPGLRRIVETQQGQAHARRRGVMESATEWIAFIDDDNYVAPDWLENACAFLDARPACGAFGGCNEIVWEEAPPPLVRATPYAYAVLDLGPEPRRLEGEERWRLRGAGLVCRKSALFAAGWLDWRVCVGRRGAGVPMSGDDLEIVMRIARAGFEIHYAPGCRLRHFITRDRLNFSYLDRIHLGFGLADPLLLGLKSRQSLAGWSIALLRRYAQLLVVLARQLPGIFLRPPDGAQKARLWASWLRGAFLGAGAVFTMNRTQRRAWLGGDKACSKEPI